jgi:predicted transposase/invertase (TIGR01784 family)
MSTGSGWPTQEEKMALDEAYFAREREILNKGRREGRQKVSAEVALNMLKESFPVEMIARVTDLTLEQIQALPKLK